MQMYFGSEWAQVHNFAHKTFKFIVEISEPPAQTDQRKVFLKNILESCSSTYKLLNQRERKREREGERERERERESTEP